jgi:voltage-gated potassium channel
VGRLVRRAVELSTMDERSGRWQRRFELPVVVAALATIPLLVLEQKHLSSPGWTIVRIANWLVWAVFAAEAVVLLSVAPSRRAWLKSHPLDVAIVLFTIPVIPGAVPALRVLRVVRLLRLVRIAPIARRVFSLDGLRYGSFLALLVMLAGGEAFAQFEKHVGLGDGIYWAVTSMTTLGYRLPQTTGGKVVEAVVNVVGVAFFAVITGAIAQRFLATEVAEIEEEMGEVEELMEEAEFEERQVVRGQYEVLDELRDIALRLQAVEAQLRAAPEFRGD